MTATAVREVGFPWYDRHATRGGREIFSYSRTYSGGACRPVFRGGVWPDLGARRAFYARFADARPEVLAEMRAQAEALGYVPCPEFDTWDEAERWLMAKEEGKTV